MELPIESYTLWELAKKEKLDWRTIKKRYEYIPVKFKNWQTKSQFNYGRSNKDYTIKYVRLKDILKLLKEEIDFTFVRKKEK
jgi:hypothetical protein